MNFSNTWANNNTTFFKQWLWKSSKILKLNVSQTFCKCWYCSSEISHDQEPVKSIFKTFGNKLIDKTCFTKEQNKFSQTNSFTLKYYDSTIQLVFGFCLTVIYPIWQNCEAKQKYTTNLIITNIENRFSSWKFILGACKWRLRNEKAALGKNGPWLNATISRLGLFINPN